MVATFFGHPWPSSSHLIEILCKISAYLGILLFHIAYIKMYIKFKMLKVVQIVKCLLEILNWQQIPVGLDLLPKEKFVINT